MSRLQLDSSRVGALRFVLAAALLTLCASAGAEPIELKASDGVSVYGELWPAASPRAPVIVAFHQAESSHAEYVPLAPRLVQAGFTVLAIDQRSGDGAFGGTNRTAAAFPKEQSYDSALPDLEAALVRAKQIAAGAPVIVWGSSYSAALVFVLASRHPGDVAAVVSFSPDEYLSGKTTVRDAARKLSMPVYVDQASDAGEVKQANAIVAALASSTKVHTVLKAKSTHGSSMLRGDTNPAGAEAHWAAVLAFLGRIKTP